MAISLPVFCLAISGSVFLLLLRFYRALLPQKKQSIEPEANTSNSEKKRIVDVDRKQELKYINPPDRRHALALLDKDALEGTECSPKALSLLPRSCETPCGFALEEARQLINCYPDYTALSGIPAPTPYKDFDLRTALPRPYRPFRWPYHQTMSLSRLDTDFWLELDKDYVSTISQRLALHEQHGDGVMQTLPGSELACRELVGMVIQFLCARYPLHFHYDNTAKTLHNGILGTSTNIESEDPLHVLLHNVPEDFAIMLRDPESGIYTFRAGIIMSSLGWNLGSKIGMKLHEIHDPVPDYRSKMQFSMDRFFAKLPTDKPIQRGSWGFEIDRPLYLPPGDPQEHLWEARDPKHTIERCHLRVDWQTLRRLPLTGAIVFNFKGLFTPVTDFRSEPYIPSLILKVLKGGNRDIITYKNTRHTEHLLIPALELYEKEQIESGMIDKNWEVQTLDEAPFYPGWASSGRRQQGL